LSELCDIAKEVFMTLPRTKVFISYSHQDKRYLEELQGHLEYFQRNQMVSAWNDQQIAPGSRWREEIEHALIVTKVALLLVSSDFLASEFIAAHELPPLLTAAQSNEVTILPVIIRPCAFYDTELKIFQSVNSPSKPLSLLTKAKREQVWIKAAKLVVGAMATVTPLSEEPNGGK
jgi:hypothetical protein